MSQRDSLQQLQAINTVLAPLDPKLPETLRSPLGTDLGAQLTDARARTIELNKQWRQAVDAERALERAAFDFVTRTRSAVRAAFGPDSAEYQLVGGTRRSERKRRTRRAEEIPTA